MAVSKALEEGATEAVCASTGNTSASAAAYCARAGIRLVVVLPEGAIARGKLAQAQIARRACDRRPGQTSTTPSTSSASWSSGTTSRS